MLRDKGVRIIASCTVGSRNIMHLAWLSRAE
jgi:hypothetical protein